MRTFLLCLVALASAEDAGILKNRHGICLDAYHRNSVSGKVGMWHCNKNNPNQQWSYDSATKQIKNKQGICLHSAGRRNGAIIDMWPCDTDDADQRFAMSKTGLIYGHNRDHNDNQLCVDASQRSKAGGKIHMWKCDENNKNQQWDFDAEHHIGVDSPDTKLIKAIYGKCLDTADRNKNGGRVLMWDCNMKNKNQQFVHDKTTKLIRNAQGMCLRNSQKKNGGLVETWSCDSADPMQQWYINNWTNQIISRRTQKDQPQLCLDSPGHKDNDGKVHVWECNPNNINQQWKVDAFAGRIADQQDSGLVKAITGLCLDVYESKPGGIVGMWDCKSSPNQKWQYDPQSQQLRNEAGYCLHNQHKKNGGKIDVWKCDTEDQFQRWSYNKWTQQLKPAYGADGKQYCLDRNGGGRGKEVHLWECVSGKGWFHHNQQWNMDTSGHVGVDDSETGFLKNTYGECVDAYSRNQYQGKVSMWNCQQGNKNQMWMYSQPDKQIKNKFGLCMSFDEAKNGGKISMDWCNSQKTNQRFYYNKWKQRVVAETANGEFCLDNWKRHERNGGELHLWKCQDNHKNQMFKLDSFRWGNKGPYGTGDAYLTITGKHLGPAGKNQLPRKHNHEKAKSCCRNACQSYDCKGGCDMWNGQTSLNFNLKYRQQLKMQCLKTCTAVIKYGQFSPFHERKKTGNRKWQIKNCENGCNYYDSCSYNGRA